MITPRRAAVFSKCRVYRSEKNRFMAVLSSECSPADHDLASRIRHM
jgi:hypothetical protein